MLKLTKQPGVMALHGLAVLLAGLLCLELQPAMQPRAFQLPSPASIPPQSQTYNVAVPQPEVATLRATLLSRPLFDATRRPPTAQAQYPTAPAPLPRLSGIMVTPTQRIAVFAPATGAPIIVNQNSRIGSFTVLAISGDSVTINGPNGLTVLRSEFNNPTQPEVSAAKTTILSEGVYLNLIKLPPPTATNPQGPSPRP